MSETRVQSGRITAYLALGPTLFAVALVVLPNTMFPFSARVAIGTLLWMGCWWVFTPVGILITALVPIVINAVFVLTDMRSLLSNYASETFFLLLGANLISIAWEETGLDKRIAVNCLSIIGPSLTNQIIVWFMASTILSMFMPNAVVCAAFIPIAISMLKYVGEDDISVSATGSIIICSIVWGAGIGGMGTPLGGAMNLIAIEHIQALTGSEFMYISWAIRMLPLLFVVVVFNIACMMFMKPKSILLKGSKEYLKTLQSQMPAMNRDEVVCLVFFAAAFVLSFARPLYQDLLPGLRPSFIFIIIGLLTFMVTKKDKTRLLTWDRAKSRIMWEIFFMFSGGMALGLLMTDAGATTSLANIIAVMNIDGGFTSILLFVAFTVIISEVSNNTTAAAISLPIVITATESLNLNPMPYVFILIAAFNGAYMLPTTIRSIPIGYGLSTIFLISRGALLTIVGIFVIAVSGYLLMVFWPGFSG